VVIASREVTPGAGSDGQWTSRRGTSKGAPREPAGPAPWLQAALFFDDPDLLFGFEVRFEDSAGFASFFDASGFAVSVFDASDALAVESAAKSPLDGAFLSASLFPEVLE
jgi:hypothetical protein